MQTLDDMLERVYLYLGALFEAEGVFLSAGAAEEEKPRKRWPSRRQRSRK